MSSLDIRAKAPEGWNGFSAVGGATEQTASLGSAPGLDLGSDRAGGIAPSCPGKDPSGSPAK
jgi:hypothetical protein